MKIKLSQALKEKNRLAGHLSRLQNILIRENTRRSDNPSKVERDKVWAEIQAVSDSLGVLKAAIATANVPIYPAIERLAELKSRISYVNNLPKRDTPELQFVGRDQEKIEYTWDPFITQSMCDKLIVEYQHQCDELQDKIDTFNATTELTVTL